MPEHVPICIRAISAEDDIEALTGLLHRSYAVLGNMGLNYTAVDQPVEVTRKRLASGLALVAVTQQRRVVGTIVFHGPGTKGGTPWLARADVAHFAQFAVEPAMQGAGIGSRLLNYVELTAQDAGGQELALDTAETAEALIGWYKKRGYRFVEHAQWHGKVYRSQILSKTL
jgi:GNAT superfamily N-acetyltransferase